MDAYNLMRKRLGARGGTEQEDRMVKDKLDTLYKAIKFSYQRETVEMDGKTFKILVNNNKLKMDYDDKIISVPFEEGVKIGSIFYWPRTKEHWIVYLKHYSEDAYFRGYIRKAQHTIRWENEFGKILETYAAVRGPVETKVTDELKSGLAFDKPNYTLALIIPYNEDTKLLKRYTKVALKDKIWKVAVANEISEPGVIELQLIEDYVHRDEDVDIIKPDKSIDIEGIKITTPLDGITQMELYEPFELWAKIEKDGVLSQELIDNAKFSLVSGNAVLTERFLNVIAPPDTVTIKLEIEKIGYEKTFVFEATPYSLPSATKFLIDGDESVKSYGKTNYELKYYLDGVSTPIPNGEWVINLNNNLFTIESKSISNIVLKWKVGSHGTLKLGYKVNDEIVASKDISVKSLI